MADLDVDADVYGLSLFGDGATVHGMPLMNILALGVGEPCAVLSIADCKFLFVLAYFFLIPHTHQLLSSFALVDTHRYRPSC